MKRVALLLKNDANTHEAIEQAIAQVSCDTRSLKAFPIGKDLSTRLRSIHKEGFDRVVVCGGDGSLHQVVGEMNRLQKPERTPISVFPLGTANDFAQAVSGGEGAITLDHCLEANVEHVDLGVVNGVPFINVATGGVPAAVTTDIDRRLKSALGKYAYYVNALAKIPSLKAVHMSFSSGDWTYEGSCYAFTIANGLTAGGGLRVAMPDAKLDDGTLDLLIVPEQPVTALVSLASALLKEDTDLSQFNVVTKRIKKLTITTNEEIQLNLDGEPVSGQKFEVSIIPSALEIAIWNDQLIGNSQQEIIE